MTAVSAHHQSRLPLRIRHTLALPVGTKRYAMVDSLQSATGSVSWSGPHTILLVPTTTTVPRAASTASSSISKSLTAKTSITTTTGSDKAHTAIIAGTLILALVGFSFTPLLSDLVHVAEKQGDL